MTAATALRQLLHDQPVDGLLFRVAGDVDWRVVDIPAEQEIGAVLIKRTPTGHRASRPCCPMRRKLGAGRSSTWYELGHRRIGLLSATASTETYRDHKAGFIEALDGHGIRVGRELVSSVTSVFDEDRRIAAERLLELLEEAHRHRLQRRLPGPRRLRGCRRARAADPRGPLGGQLRRHGVRAASPAAADDRTALVLRPRSRRGDTFFRVLEGDEVPTVQEIPVELVVRESTAPVG